MMVLLPPAHLHLHPSSPEPPVGDQPLERAALPSPLFSFLPLKFYLILTRLSRGGGPLPQSAGASRQRQITAGTFRGGDASVRK